MQALKLHIFIFLLVFITLNSFAQKGIQLKIITNTSNVELLKLLPKQTNYNSIFLIEKELQKSLAALYSYGYLAASFDSTVVSEKQFTTHFYLGEQIKWANLKKGNIDEQFISESGYREKLYNNKVFNYQQSSKLLKKLLGFYINNGYPFAKIKLDSIAINNQKITASLKVTKGTGYKIDSIQIIGDAKVSVKYLYNLLSIKPNIPFSDKDFTSIDNKLKQVPFLTVTKPSEINFYENTATIVVYINNKKTNQIDGIIGFLPNTNNGNLLITGDAKLKLLNPFKRGTLIDINWKKLQVETQDLKTQVNYPFILGSFFGVDAQLYLFKQDTSFVNVNQKLAIQYLIKGNSYFQGFVTSNSSNVLNSSLNTNFASTKYLGYGIGYKNSQVDYILNPTKGFDLIVNTSIGNKNTEQNAITTKSTQVSWENVINYYIPIFNRSTVFKASINSAQIWNNSNTILQNELHRIGGLKTLRGFNEAEIFASLYSIATIEFRYLLDQHSYFSIFYDGAYIKEETQTIKTKNFANGFGAGISFETKTGIFSLSYALGKIAGNDLLLKNGKIHFGIASYF